MGISKETKEYLEKDRKRIKREIETTVSTAKELRAEINKAKDKFQKAVVGLDEQVETGIKIDLQLAESEKSDDQVDLDGGYGSKVREIQQYWKNLADI